MYRESKEKDIATSLLGTVIAIILWYTILSREKQISSPIVYKLLHEIVSIWKSIQRGGIAGNFLGNIALFVPFGVLLPLITGKKKWFYIVGVGTCLSLLIEITQLITARGCFDPDDIILNTLGTVIGCGLYQVVVHNIN